MARRPGRVPRPRTDGAANRSHILESARGLLTGRPGATMSEVAVAAQVSRGTLYRHFATRGALLEAINRDARSAPAEPLGVEGWSAHDLDASFVLLADVLARVPPHMLGDQVVAEAQRIAGVTSAAVYLVDLDGRRLKRLAGPTGYPAELPVPLAVGTEIPPDGLPALQEMFEQLLPGATAAPLLVRGRAIGTLVAVGPSTEELRELACEAAGALASADVYTDALGAARRVRATSAAVEIQQHLLPPRIVRTSGAMIAGNVLPGCEIGGDWFDYAENADRTWVGIADATATGARAAALAAVALGAFRSARHQDRDLVAVIERMDAAVRELDLGMTLSTTVGHWVAPTSTFTWVTCGGIGPVVVSPTGAGGKIDDSPLPPLGAGGGLPEISERSRRLAPGDRLVLASDGVIDQASPERSASQVEEVVQAIRESPFQSAAGALSAVERRSARFAGLAPQDDATILVLVPGLTGDA